MIPWIGNTYVRATPLNSCPSLGIAVYESIKDGRRTGQVGFVLLRP
jgi:hypothetical protein